VKISVLRSVYALERLRTKMFISRDSMKILLPSMRIAVQLRASPPAA
jgi:hypothetical protein